MRGPLMRIFTKEQHTAILKRFPDNAQAAIEYSRASGKDVTRQNVRYWRKIFIDNGGNLAGTDRQLKAMRTFIKPQPDDDIGEDIYIPDMCHRILVIPDQHIPYHHPDMFRFLAAVAEKFDPDLVVNLGDEVDSHALSFHDSDPNLDSAGTELEKSLPVLAAMERMFPNTLVCHSNHGSLVYRKAKAHGIPVQMIKRYRDILFPETGAPGWSWSYGWRVNTPLGPVLFKHQPSGSVLIDAAHNQANLVVGHLHGDYGIQYSASSAHLYYGMNTGCLIDKDSLAFAYGKHSLRKPIIGCAVILEGMPMLIPMLLNEDGRWVGNL